MDKDKDIEMKEVDSNDNKGKPVSDVRNSEPVVEVTIPLTDEGKQKTSTTDDLQYEIEDTPPWYLSMCLGFQHYLIMFGATIVMPLVLAPFLCIGDDDNLAKGLIIGTIFFVSGISTLLQTIIGIRLPIVQGGTFTLITPAIAILSLPKWECPNTVIDSTTSPFLNDTSNFTDMEPLWKPRIREIQGAIMVASLTQVVIGMTGVVGYMLRFIGPLSIAPTISLIGLGLFRVASGFASKQWGISLLTVALIVLFSQFLKNIKLSVWLFRRGQGCGRSSHGLPLFKLFPVMLAIGIAWLLSGILTWTNVFPNDISSSNYHARTDLRMDVLRQAPWFRLPYPGQWGMPTVSLGAVLGMLAGVLASMIESVGDYYACARMCKVPPPPMHAVNRGIAMEGLGCILAGAFGTGTGTTSYSENIGAIGITKVASRRVMQYGAVVMILFSLFGKFGALFVTIPDPIVGGVFMTTFGVITAVGITNLQFVDLNSSRNVFIIGFSLLFGLMLPKHMEDNPGLIQTGVEALDQVFTILLSTSMFVGGFTGFVLDNSIPGTDEERGIIKWREQAHEDPVTDDQNDDDAVHPTSCYDIPLVTKYLRHQKWAKYMPFLPSFDEQLVTCSCRCSKKWKPAQE